ncbi:hypothetical protein LTR85_010266 [Meristemomyces frigidus]|nr:hypothetical protein LTR85_010266 [Meristemomyces frigidus]
MSSRNRVPTALEPYLRLPPEATLILLTGTLGCNVNWLTARFAGSLLARDGQPHGAGGEGQDNETAVVLVSWMRDAAFWKSEIRRGTGIDVSKMAESTRYVFVDCFSRIQALAEMEKTVASAIMAAASSGARNVVLIFDNPDVLLAITLASAQQLSSFLLGLRSLSHSTILACSADLPLLAAATSTRETMPTPIEAESAAFVVQQAHSARFVLGVRELDTGAAKDISGVMRVTRGGAAYDWEGEEAVKEDVKEMEALYLMQRDGNAMVFERGATGHG